MLMASYQKQFSKCNSVGASLMHSRYLCLAARAEPEISVRKSGRVENCLSFKQSSRSGVISQRGSYINI